MPRRKCRCKCPPKCQCACTCTLHCSCKEFCNENCYKTPARNLVVSIDGTSNQFGPNNTNVVELHSRVVKDNTSTPQLTFYVSGVGTYAPPSFRSFKYWKQVVSNKLDLAIAWNFERQVKDAYQWLADHYQPGDKIFLFGFSRGAYQARALAGMIKTVRYLPKLNFADPGESDGALTANAENLCVHFKSTFSRKVSVHFVGAWDTVSSVGVFRGQPLPLTSSADHICHFRHALALDERRVRFLPEYVNGVSEDPGDRTTRISSVAVDLKEVWFAGTHSDILDLAGVPLLWMESEATTAGLHLTPRTNVWDFEKLKREPPKESLTGPFWWFLETLPLARSTYNTSKPEETKR
ncbi:hypothetical protein GGX14DRAFT_370463 [Mycena pura]|uniref:T6SS Phospholipase effector Tle1-like catalytic domain-containing protein n=1 Tax=Mycena pura TaxID=153505 RepID=A0AAD6V3Y7_9AGAR|nr:hypothetical protein GGX14DRAFT_370463 [Mycena pura]